MKHLAFLLLSSMLMVSCFFVIDNVGYPKKVHFPPEGGTKVFVGECFLYHIVISDDSGKKGSDESNDSIRAASYKWLTAKQKWGSDTLYLTAAPAPSSQKRKLYIRGYYTDQFAEITVVQGR